jgi:ribosome modulation factor
MAIPYDQGYLEGRSQYADNRACPYEGTKNVLEWLDGFEAGVRDRRQAQPPVADGATE